MKSRACITAAATLAFGPLALAETPPPPTPVTQVGVDVIRLDATVTDKNGRPVTDLRPEEFRLKVDGKLVPVENAAFFGSTAAADGVDPEDAADAARESGRDRSIVFLIDDLNLSPGSVYWARQALRAFAAGWDSEEAMIGVRFTSDGGDKVLLSRNPARFDAAIERFRYRFGEGNANFAQRIYSLVTTINALRSAPGRKAVILVTDGLSVEYRRDQLGIDSPFDSLFPDRNTDAALRMIVEVASRAGAVVHTVHPRGLVAPWPYHGNSVLAPEEPLAGMEAWQALQTLASHTGGLAVFSRNDLKRGLLKVVADQRSYYLVGFEPPRSTFSQSGRPKFHKIKLSVDRPDVRVRTRAGFYGVTDDDVRKRVPLSASTTPAPLAMP
jgi:VWFA-related protein